MAFLYVFVCFVLPRMVESFPFMFCHWCIKLKWALFEFMLPLHYCGLETGSILLGPLWTKSSVQQAAGYPLLNRTCITLPWCIRLRNELCCVGWGVKLYSLTHCVGVQLNLWVVVYPWLQDQLMFGQSDVFWLKCCRTSHFSLENIVSFLIILVNNNNNNMCSSCLSPLF